MAKVRCPNCGRYHEIDEPKKGAFENRVRRGFRTEAMAPTFPQQPEVVNQAPTGLPSMDTHVKIPFRQTLISGMFDAPIGIAFGLGAGLSIALLVDAASRDTLTPMAYILITATGGTIGGAVSFCWKARGEWPKRLGEYDALLWIEDITGLDLNGDGEIGEPEPEVLRIELQDQQGRPRVIAELDTDRERFAELARLVVTLNLGFSEEVARQAGYNRKEWVKIRDKFIELEAARWKNAKNHKEGCYLIGNGFKLFGKVLPTPLPAGDASKNTLGTVERTRTNDLSNRYENIKGAR